MISAVFDTTTLQAATNRKGPAANEYKRDPDDEPFLDLAIATQSPFIVSRDNDLLDLMKNDDFRTAYPALAIIDPPSFLANVRSELAKTTGGK